MILSTSARTALAVGLFLPVAPGVHATTILDAFRDSQAVTIPAGGSAIMTRTVSTAVNAPHAIGGQRDVILRRESGGSADIDVGVTASGLLMFATGLRTRASALLIWDGPGTAIGTEEFGPGGLDLTESGRNTRMTFRAMSDLGVRLLFTFYKSPTEFTTAEVNVPAELLVREYEVRFDQFTGPSPESILRALAAVSM